MIESALLGLASAVCWGTSDFLSRESSRRIGYYMTSTYVQLLSFIGLTAYVTIFTPMKSSELLSNPNLVAVNLVIGVFFFLALLFLYRGYSSGVISIAAPVASSYPVVTIVLSFLLLGQSITDIKLLGIIIVLIGIVLAGFKISNLKNPMPTLDGRVTKGGRSRFAGGLDSAIIACLSLGVVYLGLNFVTMKFGFIVPVMIMRGAATATSLMLLVPLKQKFLLPKGRDLLWLILMGVIDTSGFVAFDLGILSAGGTLAIVVTLSGIFGVVTMIEARVAYHEKIERIQSIGILMLILGVLSTLYF